MSLASCAHSCQGNARPSGGLASAAIRPASVNRGRSEAVAQSIRQNESNRTRIYMPMKPIASFLNAASSKAGSSFPGSCEPKEPGSIHTTALDGLCGQCPFHPPCESGQTSQPSPSLSCESPGASTAWALSCIGAGGWNPFWLPAFYILFSALYSLGFCRRSSLSVKWQTKLFDVYQTRL